MCAFFQFKMGCMGKKQRDLWENDKDEDRISSLPDDLIHRIFSTVDANDVVRTSQLSTRWRHIWKSLPHLNFNRCHFSRLPDFSKFISQFITHRNHSGISVINLTCGYGSIDPALVRKISTYAISHNAQELNISSAVSRRGAYQIQLSTFSSRSLHHLCLNSIYLKASALPKSTWNLPALTTLILKAVSFEFCCNDDARSVDLFSNLLNLKNLSLFECYTTGLKAFNIISPHLENLIISENYWEQKRFNYVVSAPNLSSFDYIENNPMLSNGSFVTKTVVLVGINQKKKQVTILMKYFFLSNMIETEYTQVYEEPTCPSRVITKICNSEKFKLLEVLHPAVYFKTLG